MKALGKIIDSHFSSYGAILARFGYEEGWHVHPLEDRRDSYWMLCRDGGVAYSDVPFTKEEIETGANCYSGDVEGDVMRADGYAMAVVDTNADGNAFLMIFDDSRECKDAELVELYEEHWA